MCWQSLSCCKGLQPETCCSIVKAVVAKGVLLACLATVCKMVWQSFVQLSHVNTCQYVYAMQSLLA